MISFRTVHGSVEPERLQIAKDTVYLRKDIRPFSETDNLGDTYNGFSYQEAQYTKDEYIGDLSLQAAQRDSLLLDLVTKISLIEMGVK